ncbi:23335_t:CDS:2 [Cetraspora pellucida]|uniref:23335_t:CDS:1 n=1 Tax=Cetraspora pellucida TaxID=1433469 RepID=A0A9N9BZ92_9GLOM|nr:23335_t:CDS:2 [Cetraspora pellucida]
MSSQAKDSSLMMVAVDFSNIPTRVPHVKTVQPQMIEVFEGAKTRRNHRLLQRKEIVQKELSTHPEEFEQFTSNQDSL